MEAGTACRRGGVLYGCRQREPPSWVHQYLPKGTDFSDGSFQGWAEIESPEKFRVAGNLLARSAKASGEQLLSPSIALDLNSSRVTVRIQRATYEGEPLYGAFAINTKEKTILGSASSPQLDLGQVRCALRVGSTVRHGITHYRS